MRHLSEDINSRMPRFVAQLQKAGRNARLIKLSRDTQSTDLEGVVRYLGTVDPTGKAAKYVAWIADMMLSGQVILPEDADRINYLLKIFHAAKRSSTFPHDKNIFNYKNFSEFAKMVESLGGGEEKTKEPQNLSVRKWKAWIERQGYTKFYGDNVYTILRFDLTGETEEVVATTNRRGYYTDYLPVWSVDLNKMDGFEGPLANPISVDTGALAVSRLTTGTAYCVQSPQTAEGYLKGGPLFALFREGSLYALSTSQWTEFRDTSDVSLAIPSPALAYFLSKMLLDKSGELHKHGVGVVQRLIGRGMSEYAARIPQKPKAIILAALEQPDQVVSQS